MARKCWAASLGDCAGKITKEHLVSRTLFPDGVKVQGFKWCKTAPKSTSHLKAAILCKKHNNDLSEVDEAAGRAFRTLRRFFDLAVICSKSGLCTNEVLEVDGPLLERWLLKTLINFNTVAPGLSIGDPMQGNPSRELVEIAFGRRDFPAGAGLYMACEVGTQIVEGDQFGCTSLTHTPNDKTIRAGRFNFRGYTFFLHLEGWRLPDTNLMYGRSTVKQVVLNWVRPAVGIDVIKNYPQYMHGLFPKVPCHAVAFRW